MRSQQEPAGREMCVWMCWMNECRSWFIGPREPLSARPAESWRLQPLCKTNPAFSFCCSHHTTLYRREDRLFPRVAAATKWPWVSVLLRYEAKSAPHERQLLQWRAVWRQDGSLWALPNWRGVNDTADCSRYLSLIMIPGNILRLSPQLNILKVEFMWGVIGGYWNLNGLITSEAPMNQKVLNLRDERPSVARIIYCFKYVPRTDQSLLSRNLSETSYSNRVCPEANTLRTIS